MHQEFTAEEWQVIAKLTSERARSGASFFATAMLAPVLFAAYGAVLRDFLAVLIAFVGVFALFCWFLSASRGNSKVLGSICAKLLAARGTGRVGGVSGEA